MLETPSSAPPSRPLQLDDPVWLTARYEQVGDRGIARELGVSRGMVRAARVRLSIGSRPPGRPRGLAPGSSPFSCGTIDAFLAQFERDSAPDGPAPAEDLIASRMTVAHEERWSGGTDYDDALIRIASAACLVHRERQLRRTA